MKLEYGKTYKTRDGRKVGPMVYWDSSYQDLHPFTDEEQSLLWTPEGIGYEGRYPEQDIISEWEEPMTDYNGGKWHGWNGSECPVHPNTLIQVVGGWSAPRETVASPEEVYWPSVVAFRVIKEYKEPREYWVCPDHNIVTASYYEGFIHVREVTE